MSSKIARRVGAIAGLVLIPTIALGTAANAAVSSQASSPAPAVQKQASGSAARNIVVKGTITSVKHDQGKKGKAETITVRGGHGKSTAFNVLPTTRVTKGGHRVPASALAPSQHVTVHGKKAPKNGTDFAQRVAING